MVDVWCEQKNMQFALYFLISDLPISTLDSDDLTLFFNQWKMKEALLKNKKGRKKTSDKEANFKFGIWDEVPLVVNHPFENVFVAVKGKWAADT